LSEFATTWRFNTALRGFGGRRGPRRIRVGARTLSWHGACKENRIENVAGRTHEMNAGTLTVTSNRTMALVAYLLHLFGAITGVPSIIGLIVNYVSRRGYGEVPSSHHAWMIRSFWWALLFVVIGWFTRWMLGIGYVIWVATWAWYVYRHVRGVVALVNDEPLPR